MKLHRDSKGRFVKRWWHSTLPPVVKVLLIFYAFAVAHLCFWPDSPDVPEPVSTSLIEQTLVIELEAYNKGFQEGMEARETSAETLNRGFRSGITRGSNDTLRIFADLTALGHPWDYEEIQRRLAEMNP